MTKSQILEIFGKSVYQIQLELAMQLCVAHTTAPRQAWKDASKFIAMLAEIEIEEK